MTYRNIVALMQQHSFGKRAGASPDPYAVARRRMVSEQLLPGGIRDSRVLEAMGRVPRHAFVSPGMEDQAYLDRPLPIGAAQTISQPIIVALMSEALALSGSERVLEIGTGSGYQAAILAELASQVYTVERLRDLSIRARKALYRLGYQNVHLRIGDGTLGWEEEAPFDRIIVTAGAPSVPERLRLQLAEGGRLVIPVGGEELQQLDVITREEGQFHTHSITACRFVKLIGEHGWRGE